MRISILGVVAILVFILLGIAVFVALRIRKKLKQDASRAGYPTIKMYLQSTPHSDREKRDAIDLALTGAIVCLLGFLFPPLIFAGVFPLYYGSRKIACASLGLGLMDYEDEKSGE